MSETIPSSKQAAGRKKQLAAAVAKIVVSAALLWALFGIYDIESAMGRIAAIDPFWTVAAFACMAVFLFLAATRWWLVMKAMGMHAPLTSVTGLMVIAVFFNQTLPSNLGGDVMRVWRLFKQGERLQQAVGCILVDHVVSFIGLAFLVLLALPWAIMWIGSLFVLYLLLALIGGIVAGLAVLLLLDRIPVRLSRILPDRLWNSVAELSRDAKEVFVAKREILPLLLMATLAHAMIVVMMATLARGLGIVFDFGAFLAVVPPAVVASFLPMSFAGWGVREGAMVGLLGSIGIVPEEALALSVAFGFLYLIGSLPGGILWLVTGNRGDIEKEAG